MTGSKLSESVDFDDLQGNILRGHGRDHTAHVFVRFDGDLGAVRRWLRQFLDASSAPGAPVVTSFRAQNEQRDAARNAGDVSSLFVGLLLTATAYDFLARDSKIPPPEDSAFRAGMKARGTLLNDPPTSTWDSGLSERIDAQVLLASDDRAVLESAAQRVRSDVESIARSIVVYDQRGNALRNPAGESIEHFGYVDGRSQPRFLEEDIDQQMNATDGISVWDPRADALKLCLVRDPSGDGVKSFGSYFVFRKLEQNVRRFKEREKFLAQVLGLEGDDAERAGALIVGRFEDGTPLVAQNEEGASHPVPNNFDYASDPEGRRCPLQAHIRKVNPRDGSERTHLIARRGIPYGDRDDDLNDRPEKDVGLLFMCFQSDIQNQFEFIQGKWANSDDLPSRPNSHVPFGMDPIIGQPSPRAAPHTPRWPTEWGGEDSRSLDFYGFVTLKGGEYFFAPSLSGLRRIAGPNV